MALALAFVVTVAVTVAMDMALVVAVVVTVVVAVAVVVAVLVVVVVIIAVVVTVTVVVTMNVAVAVALAVDTKWMVEGVVPASHKDFGRWCPEVLLARLMKLAGARSDAACTGPGTWRNSWQEAAQWAQPHRG